MTQLVFLADIHNQGDSIGESLQNAGASIAEGSIAVLLEIDEGDDYLIPKSQYDEVLKIICEDKLDSSDYKLVKNMMLESNNSVYAFDCEGGAQSIERQNCQREKICEILKQPDVKNKASVVVIDGIAHLQYQQGKPDWLPLQITPPKYPNVASIKAGFPDGEDING